MQLTLTLASTLAQAGQSASQSGDDSQWMIYAIIAFGMALALVVLEAFVPSGGVLGILAGVLAIGGVIMFFMFDTTWGMVSMAVSLAALPFIIAGMIWIWPNTPIGKALTLEDEPRDTAPADPGASDLVAVGTEGEALTELRPVGACRLDGSRIDCIAQAGVIEKGTAVKVISVEGTSIKVKAV